MFLNRTGSNDLDNLAKYVDISLPPSDNCNILSRFKLLGLLTLLCFIFLLFIALHLVL